MKLRSKLIMASLVPLILALLMVGFIVIKMTQLQANNSSYVPVLIEVQKLNASLVNSEQTLSAYAGSVSDGNKSATLTALSLSKKEIAKLSKMPLQPKHRMTLKNIQKKTDVLTKSAKKALSSGDAAEVKRQSLRIRGILNDVYLLDYQTTQYYHQLTTQLKTNIQFVITSAVIGSIILVVLALGFGLWMALQLSSRIQRLADNAKAVASGNLNIEIEETRGRDEVAELQSAFNEMIYNLKDIMRRISAASNELGTFSEDVSSQNHVLKEMSQQIAVSTDEMAQGAQSISAELLDAKESVDQMNEAFEESLIEVNHASSASLDTVESIKDGQQAIDIQKDYLMESVKNSKQMGVSMKNFSQQTKEIEKMAQLVSEISDETNLLALNASIEAARAGEYGKGFAVVASEIRKLADGSQQATKQIFDLIQKLNEGQSVVLETIEVSRQGVKRQEASMADTTEAFNAIDTHVQSIDNRIKFLAERMAESRERANRFSKVIENVSSVTEESAAGSEEISASTTEQLDAIGKMLENVEELNQTANRLKEGMQHFSKGEKSEE